MKPTIFITGISSGLGRALAFELMDDYDVIGSVRIFKWLPYSWIEQKIIKQLKLGQKPR